MGPYDNLIQTDAHQPGQQRRPALRPQRRRDRHQHGHHRSGQNLGFAVPVNMVKESPLAPEKGRPDMGWLGVSAQAMTPDIAEALGLDETAGVPLACGEGRPRDKAGLKRGTSSGTDGKRIFEPAELSGWSHSAISEDRHAQGVP